MAKDTARTAIFDTVRKILGRGFTQNEVETLDDAIDCAGGDNRACERLRPAFQLTAGSQAFELIKRFEGCASQRADGLIEAYPDPGTGGAPWTIGWGGDRDRYRPRHAMDARTMRCAFGRRCCAPRKGRSRSLRQHSDQSGAIRCLGQLPLQHRCDPLGHTDREAPQRRPCGRERRIRAVEQGRRAGAERVGQAQAGRSPRLCKRLTRWLKNLRAWAAYHLSRWGWEPDCRVWSHSRSSADALPVQFGPNRHG